MIYFQYYYKKYAKLIPPKIQVPNLTEFNLVCQKKMEELHSSIMENINRK
jgi:hypothetical protein